MLGKPWWSPLWYEGWSCGKVQGASALSGPTLHPLRISSASNCNTWFSSHISINKTQEKPPSLAGRHTTTVWSWTGTSGMIRNTLVSWIKILLQNNGLLLVPQCRILYKVESTDSMEKSLCSQNCWDFVLKTIWVSLHNKFCIYIGLHKLRHSFRL